MSKGIIFSNPPAKTREGQQKRGMFPLSLIALADFLDQDIRIENISPDLLADYSSKKPYIEHQKRLRFGAFNFSKKGLVSHVGKNIRSEMISAESA